MADLAPQQQHDMELGELIRWTSDTGHMIHVMSNGWTHIQHKERQIEIRNNSLLTAIRAARRAWEQNKK